MLRYWKHETPVTAKGSHDTRIEYYPEARVLLVVRDPRACGDGYDAKRRRLPIYLDQFTDPEQAQLAYFIFEEMMRNL